MPLAMDAIVKLAAARDIELTIPDVEPQPGGVTQPASHYAKSQNASAPAARGNGLRRLLAVRATGADRGPRGRRSSWFARRLSSSA